jgi:SagB-type dehydrogenase family enzyme
MEMKRLAAPLAGVAATALAIAIGCSAEAPGAAQQEIVLPAPVTTGGMSLDEALAHRRSVRSYQSKALTQQQIGQLLWAAQGITDAATGHRTAPSAMARYPLTLYVFTSDGVYTYEPNGHKLVRHAEGDQRAKLAEAARGQRGILQAPVDLVFTGDPEKMGARAAGLADRFIYLETGHAAENLALQATALGLGTVTMGGIDPAAVGKVLGLPERILVMYVMPVGYPAAQ